MNPTAIASPPSIPHAPASGAQIGSPQRSRGPTPFRWTIKEYRGLDKTGLFHGKKTMLLDGVVYLMPMPGPPHDEALNLVYEFLRAAFTTGHHVRNQQGFDIGTHNDPGPDLAVVTGSIRDYHGHTPTSAVMIVEVAEDSLFVDSTTKAELYATAGVPDHWVIDLEHRQLIVFRDPQPLPTGLGATAYKTHLTFGPSDRVSPLAAPQASIVVNDLLP